MVLLALETATRAGSLALWRDGRTVSQAGDAAVTHGQRLPGEITAFLAGHTLALGDVDVLAVAAGPGSFTGLRVGIASVQGLALASARRVVPVSTLDAIGEAWLAASPGFSGLLVACLDGLRGEVFAAAWDVAADATTLADASARLEATVLAPGALATRCRELATGRPIAFVGSGAQRYRDLLQAAVSGAMVAVPSMPLAEAIARIAGRRPLARRKSGDRRKLRAHPPLEPGRHGRAPAPVPERAEPRIARPDGL
jgi:tRNA threonylcarbamoyladenosine biosynthesis protein TsaB